MIDVIKKVVKDCLTGPDGESYDPARVGLCVSLTAYLLYSGYALMHNHQPWDPQAFGIGLGAVMAAGAWGVAAKSHTEPPAKP